MHRHTGQSAGTLERYTTSWRDRVPALQSAFLDIFGNKFFDELQKNGSVIDRYCRGTGSILATAVAGRRVRFADTGTDYCLHPDEKNGLVVVNRALFDAIAARLLNDIAVGGFGRDVDARRYVRSALRSSVRMVVGHELFHQAQGAQSIDIVRTAAKALGWSEFAKLDVDADFRAAAVEAAFSARETGNLSFRRVLQHFEDALAFQVRYCVPVFKCPAEKPHKRSRVASIVLQLGRVVSANRTMTRIDEADFRSLTMPLYVIFNTDYSELGIMGLDPLIYVGSSSFEKNELKEFFDRLDSGDVEGLVKTAIEINARIGLVPV